MKNINKINIAASSLIVVGSILFALSYFTEFQYKSEGAFVSSIGLVILAYRSLKNEKLDEV